MACQPPKAEGGTGWQIDAEYPRISPVASGDGGGAGTSSGGEIVPAVNEEVAASGASAYLERHGVEGAISKAVAGCVRETPQDALAYIGRSLLAQGLGKKTAQVVSRKTDLGDSIMTAITIAPLSASPYSFTNLGVLRKQECEVRTDATPQARRATSPTHRAASPQHTHAPSAAHSRARATLAAHAPRATTLVPITPHSPMPHGPRPHSPMPHGSRPHSPRPHSPMPHGPRPRREMTRLTGGALPIS